MNLHTKKLPQYSRSMTSRVTFMSGRRCWDFLLLTFWPNYNLDLYSYWQLLSSFLRIYQVTKIIYDFYFHTAVPDTEYSEGDDNSGRGLSAREEGLTTSVEDPGSADPGSGSAYFYRDPVPQIRDPDPRIFIGIQIRDPRSAWKTVRISNTGSYVLIFLPS